MDRFEVKFFGNKEVFVSTDLTGIDGPFRIIRYGTYRKNDSLEYRDFVVNRLKDDIHRSMGVSSFKRGL